MEDFSESFMITGVKDAWAAANGVIKIMARIFQNKKDKATAAKCPGDPFGGVQTACSVFWAGFYVLAHVVTAVYNIVSSNV